MTNSIEKENWLKIKKKLKLMGEPEKVFKKTAIIKNMFNS